MFTVLCRRYRNDTAHRVTVEEYPNRKFAFVPMEDAKRVYASNGFDIKKKSPTALDRHIQLWEFIGCAELQTIDGVQGIVIDLSASA